MSLKSEQINELAAALSRAQSEMKSAEKHAENPYFNSKYATLENVWEACRAALTKNGLSVSQTVEKDEKDILLCTFLLHTSGQWIKSDLPLLLTKVDMQGLGSALTYARRYALAAICGVAQEDDDAEGSLKVERPAAKPKTPLTSFEMGLHSTKKPSLVTSGVKCSGCSTELVLTKSGEKYYCPKFTDLPQVQHTVIPANELEKHRKKMSAMMEPGSTG